MEGWILDVYTRQNEAVVWLQTKEGLPLRLSEPYSPSFYILPKDKGSEKELYWILQQHQNIKGVVSEDKYTKLGSTQKRTLLRVIVDDALNYKKIKEATKKLPQTGKLYNGDLLHVQQYLFTQLEITPTSKVRVIYDAKNQIKSARLVDDSNEIAPPPFTTIFFNIHIDSSNPTPDPRHDPINRILINTVNDTILLQSKESDVLQGLNAIVNENDPDLIVCPQCYSFVIPYLFKRAEVLDVDLQLESECSDASRKGNALFYRTQGRVLLDYSLFGCSFEHWGLPGLVERARFSFLPLGIASRWTSNRVIDSRNCYELIKRGYVIPENTGQYEHIRRMSDVVSRDRGGLIIASRIGVVHENVAELDFESQYPNLIVRDLLSYETVTPQGVVKNEREPLLPYVTKKFLDRRLQFKRLRKRYSKDSKEWLWCEQRQHSLKMILVCLYGTSGCCWNRFGNVICFEEINKRSRETLMKTKTLLQQRGFEVVYADTDSIFIKRLGCTRQEYEDIAKEVGNTIGLPMALDNHYKFLLLLPIESDLSGNMEAQKHYLGVLTTGESLMKGIESRRHDTPELVKVFQKRLIRELFDVESAEEVPSVGYKKAIRYVNEFLKEITSGEVSMSQLIVSKVLRKPLNAYTSFLPHVSAAVSLVQQHKMVRAGETIKFVYVNARHPNPLRRVAPSDIYDDDYYDREKYRDLVIDAAETVLSTFGFKRQKFGLGSKTLSHKELLWRE